MTSAREIIMNDDLLAKVAELQPMTRYDAQRIFARLGVTPEAMSNASALHVAYCRWIHDYSKGLAPYERVGEAYHEARKVEAPKTQQAALFAKGPEAL